jgi:HptB-dependent secretion and biofilm anti anti-sigma factor
MTVQMQMLDNGAVVKISVLGRFDFHAHREFRDAYQAQSPTVQYLVDLRGTDYMDSSALGMLLLLREHAGGDNAKIRISNARAEILSILSVANFEKMFVIE